MFSIVVDYSKTCLGKRTLWVNLCCLWELKTNGKSKENVILLLLHIQICSRLLCAVRCGVAYRRRINPFFHIILVQFILIFISSWSKTARAARNRINSVPQTAGTTFAFSCEYGIRNYADTDGKFWVFGLWGVKGGWGWAPHLTVHVRNSLHIFDLSSNTVILKKFQKPHHSSLRGDVVLTLMTGVPSCAKDIAPFLTHYTYVKNHF